MHIPTDPSKPLDSLPAPMLTHERCIKVSMGTSLYYKGSLNLGAFSLFPNQKRVCQSDRIRVGFGVRIRLGVKVMVRVGIELGSRSWVEKG